jgi:hypothetical protein
VNGYLIGAIFVGVLVVLYLAWRALYHEEPGVAAAENKKKLKNNAIMRQAEEIAAEAITESSETKISDNNAEIDKAELDLAKASKDSKKIEEIIKKLESGNKSLSHAEIEKELKRHGFNVEDF